MTEEHRPEELGFTPNPDDPIRIPMPDRLPFPVEPVPLPPDWWRCLRRGPVSGRYEGEMTEPTAGRSVLDLRVDIDPRYANSPVLDRISGDLYNAYRIFWPGGPSFSWRLYRESWIVDAPAVRWARCSVEINGTVRYWKGTHPVTTVRVRIPWGTFQPAGPAEVTFTEAGGTTRSYTCARKSDAFRDVILEADVTQSVNNPPLLPSYDTHAHATRPAGLPQRTLTFEEAYREAGISVRVEPVHTVIDDSAPQFTSWSDAELHDAMETHFSTYATSVSWRVWGVMVGRHDNSGLAGIMFDYGTAYGGPGRSPERQGFAVFRGHPVFNNLPAGVPANQAEAETLRYFLYAWVHEAGHAFNYMHSWDKGQPNALSWMNYPQYVSNFWNDFEFRFGDEELIHLRHGDRSSVIFGGDPWASGGHLEVPPGAMVQMEGAAPLELLLRSQGYFEFLEPVVVELRLRNLSAMPLGVDTRLSPEHGRVAIYIQRPDRRIIRYTPIIHREGTPQASVLSPAGVGVEGADRFSENVALTFHRQGFIFDTPGEYVVRAIYTGPHELVIVSNTMRVRVGSPVSREEDRLAQDHFSPQVGMALYLGGSQSPYLQQGMEHLEKLVERSADSPVGAKAATVLARSLARPFFRIRDPQQRVLTQVHKAEPGRALELTRPALERYRRVPDRALNIAYHQLVRRRAELLRAAGQERQANEELTRLHEDLGARGVNPSVLADIKGFIENVPGKSGGQGKVARKQPRR